MACENIIWRDLTLKIEDLDDEHQKNIYEAVQVMVKYSGVTRKTRKYINQIVKLDQEKAQ